MPKQTSGPGRQTTSRRKAEHLDIALNEDIGFPGVTTGFERYSLVHQALPDLDMNDIDLSITMFGKRLNAPLIIEPMTGGTPPAGPINRNLAGAAQALGLAMGVGSQRAALESRRAARSYLVRDAAPDILLMANLGAVQLNYGYGVDECRRAVEMIGADALILHLNPLQEALQGKGNVDFRGLLGKIEAICRSLDVPVIVKEVGFGISESVARQLSAAGVAGIDVAGAGGTSWVQIEARRTGASPGLVDALDSWGIPTADSLLMARKGAPSTPIIASGGIRNGVDAAKALALGADAAGLAGPLLKPATESIEAVVAALSDIITALRVAMFCAGAHNIAALKKAEVIDSTKAPQL